MGFIRPATPGFLVTLVASILLAVVSFGVPYLHSIYFLKATYTSSGISGSITFGTLGYCLEISNGTTCSKPSIGYELDINGLVGNNLPVKIPQVVVKWVTYALFLHIVALVLAAGSAFFGLLAHVREMSMTCCSTCISGFAAAVALVAFIFDLAFFFLAKDRINNVKGGSAAIGNAMWLTLAAWVLLFFSGCFYTLGRRCISTRGPRSQRDGDREVAPGGNGYAEQMRLDAVKAEADRKARQKQAEGGLPAFQEYEPLKKNISSDEIHLTDDGTDNYNNIPGETAAGYGRQASQTGYHSGYAQATPGTRAVDEYYNPTRNQAGSYPPQPQRQNSGHTLSTSGYAPANPQYGQDPTGNQAGSAYPPQPQRQNSGHTLSTSGYAPTNPQYGQDPYNTNQYGHTAGGTTYHSAASHQQYPSNYDYGAYVAPQPQYTETYNNVSSQPFYPQTSPGHQPDRSYTLGGGYGAYISPLTEHPQDSSFLPYPGDHVMSASPAPINTGSPPPPTSPVRGPRAMASPVHEPFDESPPSYDTGIAQAWGGNR